MVHRLLLTCSVLVLLSFSAAHTIAQETPTNMSLLEQLGLDCLRDVPASADSLVLQSPAAMPYVASALIRHLQHDGRTVFVPDSAQGRKPTLVWDVVAGGIDYARASRKEVTRTATLELRYEWIAVSGEVVASETCHQTITDIVPRDLLASLETAAYPETQAEPPPARWTKRYLEPLMWGAVTVVTVFLFFNLRSSRADS